MKTRAALAILSFFLLAGALPAVDQHLLSLVMPDAKVLAGVNVDLAKTSPFGQYVLAHMQADSNGLQKFIQQTGFDPGKDLTEVLMASRGDSGRKGLVLARGTFNAAGILQAAAKAGGTVETYNGIQIISGKDESQTHALAFLDNGATAVAGDLDSIKAAIDRSAHPNGSLDPALVAKVGQLSTALDAWTVSFVPVSAMGTHTPGPVLPAPLQGDLLKTIQQASGGVKFGAIVQISGEAVAKDAKDASSLADVIKFFATMIQMNAPAKNGAQFISLVQSLNVTTDKNTVRLALNIPEDQLESILSAGMMASARHAHGAGDREHGAEQQGEHRR